VKLFYITTIERMQCVIHAWHSLDLGNEKFLICVDWKDDMQEAEWAQSEGVMPLPHPIFQMADPLTDEHLAHLTQRFTLEKGNTIHDAIKAAARHDPWMRLHVL
jgi:hypothetical protein